MDNLCRRLAVLFLLVLVGAPLEARGASEKGDAPAEAAGKKEEAAPREYYEAPMLAEPGSGAKLDAVAKRLPKEPLVVSSSGGAGSYGGTWRQAMTRAELRSLWTRGIRARVLRSTEGVVEAELVASYESSSDNRTFTFHLRQGLRWSDGQICDADDYVFAYEAVLADADLTPLKPQELVGAGRLPRIDKIDQYTVTYTFSEPNAVFLRRLAQPRAEAILLLPEHYLKQFHSRYAGEEKLAELVSQGGYTGWIELFYAMSRPETNPKLPVLDPWIAVDDGSSGVLHLERNPYFWQVDAEGNQLPYIDRLEVTICADVADLVAKASTGQVDLQIPEASALGWRGVLAEQAEAGGYRLVDVAPMNANIHTIFLNPAVADAPKAALFADMRFREALSIAIDREGINQAVHGGLCTPSQVAPPPGSAAYDEDAALIYTELDLERAGELLDELGLSWDAQHERRLGTDGKPFVLTAAYPASWPPGQAQAVASIRESWAKLGIALEPQELERPAWLELMREGGWELGVYAVNAGGDPYLCLSSDGVFPLDDYWFPAPQWGLWVATKGEEGTEPPADVKRLSTLYEEYVSSASGERPLEIEKEAFGLYARDLLAIGLLTRPRGEVYAVVSSRVRGLPEGALLDDLSCLRPGSFWLAN